MSRSSWRAFVRGIPILVVAVATCFTAPESLAISRQLVLAYSGTAPLGLLGNSVSSAGDVNGDGYGDVIVGALSHDAGGFGAGQAYVFYGGPQTDAVPDLTFTGAAGDQLGSSVSTAGDMNGDGYADVLVGAPGAGGGFGRVYIYYGGSAPDAVADLTLMGEAVQDFFGRSVSAAGDVNGDGLSDVIVGAHGNDAAGEESGRTYIYHGGDDSAPDVTLTGRAAFSNFGMVVSGGGDFNADGYSDVTVAAVGRAYVYYMSPSADTLSDLTLVGAPTSEDFGTSLSSAMDANGDGFADVVVGAPGNSAGAGRVYLYFGGTSADSLWDRIVGGSTSEALGSSVSAAGDVNGDGFADILIGAPGGDLDFGQVNVLYGGPSVGNDGLTLQGSAVGDAFGAFVSGAGDVNGDGYPDVIVGAHLDDSGGEDAGRIYVYSLFPYRVTAPQPGETWVAGAPATVRWLGHDPADLALSTDGGLSWSSIASGVGGLAENSYTITVPLIASASAKVRITYAGQTSNRSNSDGSEGFFRIVLPIDPPSAAHRLHLALAGQAAGDEFGFSGCSAGDVNGDGYGDVIVGAYQNDGGGTNAGRAYVFYGGPGADTAPDLTLTGAAAGDQFGYSVSGAGDMNGDGHADVVVGAYGNSSGGPGAGRAYVYYGGPSADAVPDLTLTGAAAGDQFGISVAGAGDVNGDGYGDVIIGANGNDAGAPDAGRAYVYYGGSVADAVADLILTGSAAADLFGYSVSGAGDMNGDGYGDVIVGAYANDAGGTNAGRAYVYFGGPGTDAVADLNLTGAAAGDQFGVSVSEAGDVNKDGYGDAIVGADGNDAGGLDAGRAYVYYGGPGTYDEADLILTGAAAGDRFGGSVSGARDVNGDTCDDVIVGAYLNDAGGVDAGRAYVYYGGPGADTEPDATVTGAVADDFLGISVSEAGDVNGNGQNDVVVGVSFSDIGGPNSGRSHVYDFSRYIVTAPNGGEIWNVGAMKTVSWLGAEPADLWLSVDGGITHELLERSQGGAATNAFTLRVPHTPTKFAQIRLTPSDASIGGFDRSDSMFTIQTSVALLSMLAAPLPGGGATITWETNPGPEDLSGYYVERSAAGAGRWTTLVGLTRATSVTDPEGGPGTRYRLFAVNGFGESLLLGETSIRPVEPLAAWPLPYRGGDLNVSFATPGGFGGGAAEADVAIFDVRGRLVKRLARGAYAQGYNTVLWNGRDEKGSAVASGIYFLRSSSLGEQRTLRLSVLR